MSALGLGFKYTINFADNPMLAACDFATIQSESSLLKLRTKSYYFKAIQAIKSLFLFDSRQFLTNKIIKNGMEQSIPLSFIEELNLYIIAAS